MLQLLMLLWYIRFFGEERGGREFSQPMPSKHQVCITFTNAIALSLFILLMCL